MLLHGTVTWNVGMMTVWQKGAGDTATRDNKTGKTNEDAFGCHEAG